MPLDNPVITTQIVHTSINNIQSSDINALTAAVIRCADHVTPSIRKKLALASLTSGGRSVAIVRLRTTSHGV
jgi:hypothetical protein